MADTGWLKPAASEITTSPPPGEGGNPWNYTEWMALWQNFGARSFAMSKDSRFPPVTDVIAWNWVVPVGSYPNNAVITGLEYRIWAYQYQHEMTPPNSMSPVHMLSGQKTIIDEAPGNPATLPYLVENHEDLPGGLTGPLRTDPPTHNVVIGGPGQLFGMAANSPVSDFFTYDSLLRPDGGFHTTLRYRNGEEYDYREAAINLQYVEMKIYYDIPATHKDIAATPEVALTVPVSDLTMIRRLGAVVITDVLIEQAQLGGIAAIASDPGVEVGMPADITTGTGFIDSTAYPTVVVTIPDIDLALLRFSDMSSDPEVSVELDSRLPGTRVDLSSGPWVRVNLAEGFVNAVPNAAEPEIAVTLDADLVLDVQMGSAPHIVVSATANLQGDINMASWCGEALLETVVTLIGDLGYTRGIYSDPKIYVTMDVDGLVVGAALEFAPLVSVTIPRAGLRSKYAEPAPDHRTVFKCPVDRTIRITRKDKTIL